MGRAFNGFKRCKQEFTIFRETLKRGLSTDIRKVKVDLRDVIISMEFMSGSFQDMKSRLEAAIIENCQLMIENQELVRSAAPSKLTIWKLKPDLLIVSSTVEDPTLKSREFNIKIMRTSCQSFQ